MWQEMSSADWLVGAGKGLRIELCRGGQECLFWEGRVRQWVTVVFCLFWRLEVCYSVMLVFGLEVMFWNQLVVG